MKSTNYFKPIISFIIVIIIASLCACGGRNNSGNQYNSPSMSGTETETLKIPPHLNNSQNEWTEDMAYGTEKGENKTEHLTEAPTEQPKETEKITEKVTEIITEKIETPITSLRYISYNNGTCAVTGIGNCTDSCIVIPEKNPDGDIVTAIEDKAFYGNTDIKAVEIPSTVSSIGNMAFGGCTSLVYISVDKNNKSFTDVNGILYSIDGTQLLAYPSSCGLSELNISSKVTRIADMAFYGCYSLKSINYNGTLEGWGKIAIGEMNYGLFTASVNCSNSGY